MDEYQGMYSNGAANFEKFPKYAAVGKRLRTTDLILNFFSTTEHLANNKFTIYTVACKRLKHIPCIIFKNLKLKIFK